MDARSPTVLSYPDLAPIFADIFQYTDTLTAETSPDDVATWDSLQHIALIRTLEMT